MVRVDENLQGAFCKLCKKGGRFLLGTGGAWITKPFTNLKRTDSENVIKFKKRSAPSILSIGHGS